MTQMQWLSKQLGYELPSGTPWLQSLSFLVRYVIPDTGGDSLLSILSLRFVKMDEWDTILANT